MDTQGLVKNILVDVIAGTIKDCKDKPYHPEKYTCAKCLLVGVCEGLKDLKREC